MIQAKQNYVNNVDRLGERSETKRTSSGRDDESRGMSPTKGRLGRGTFELFKEQRVRVLGCRFGHSGAPTDQAPYK